MAPLTEQEPDCLPVGTEPVGEVPVALVVVVVEVLVVVVGPVGGVTDPLLIKKRMKHT